MGSHKRRKLSSKQQKVHYMVLCGNRRAEETANAKALGQQQMCIWNKRKVSVAEASLARGRRAAQCLILHSVYSGLPASFLLLNSLKLEEGGLG